MLLHRKDESSFGWWNISNLTKKYDYSEDCITAEQLEALLKEHLNMRDFKIELHNFPHQKDEENHWCGYRGYYINNQVFKVQIQFQNTHYVECLLNGFSKINYFYMDKQPTYDNIYAIVYGVKHRIKEMVKIRQNELKLISKLA